MARKWEHFYFIGNILITQAVVFCPAGTPGCCRSLRSGGVREATLESAECEISAESIRNFSWDIYLAVPNKFLGCHLGEGFLL